MPAENKMSEAEVSLRLAFFLIEQDFASSDAEVAIDGAQVQTGNMVHFPILNFLAAHGWNRELKGSTWQGAYKHPKWSFRISISSNPGKGDVVAKLKNGQVLRAECKKGTLTPSRSSAEYSLIREALGSLLTIEHISPTDLLVVAIPSNARADNLAAKWRKAPLVKRVGIHIITLNRNNEVIGLPSLGPDATEGCKRIADLLTSSLEEIPDRPGIYKVLRPNLGHPSFLSESPAGWFKKKSPSVFIDELQKKWVPGAEIVYIGKAGGESQDVTLRSRIKTLLEFGKGHPVPHWGGRYIWQLKNADDLIVCWQITQNESPEAVEKRMLQEFRNKNGVLPFANLRS